MAHKLVNGQDEKIKKKVKLPSFDGKVGFSLYLGTKEVFIGISINEVITEKVVRRKMLKTPKRTAKVFNFDY